MRYLIGRDELRRWLLHGMVRSTIQLAKRVNQVMYSTCLSEYHWTYTFKVILIKILWTDLWPVARNLGLLGAQLADLLSTYAPRLLPTADLKTMADLEMKAIKDASRRFGLVQL